MNRTPSSLALLTLVVALAAPLAGAPPPGERDSSTLETFEAGSFIIPMDTDPNGQDNGMLRAYGLVYALLRNNVPVNWTINPSKSSNGNDFSIVAGLQDVETSALVGARSYRGGPFVIDAADAAAALPIILEWLAVPGDNTVVHRLTSGSFSANVERTLIGAPRIAILSDGNEAIAFNNLNSAGIPDSSGSPWSFDSPDLLTEVQVSGPTGNAGDGALIDADTGLARFCYLASMSYVPTINTPQVVQEVRSWLDQGPLTHAFMQNAATTVFENDDLSGQFLTTAGIEDDGLAPADVTNRVPADPLTQIDGAFQADFGAVDSINLAGGSFKTGVRTMLNAAGLSVITDIVLLNGNLDGSLEKGQVTYLAGHDYSVALPISTNPQTNGVRLFLNSVFASGCATEPAEEVVTLTKAAPAFTTVNQIVYSIAYGNSGPRVVDHVTLTDRLPAGTTYVSGSGPSEPIHSAGVVTWHLASVGPGGNGTVSFTVEVNAGDGTYNNAARMSFSHLTVGSTWSNVVATERDTDPPIVTIPGAPINPTATDDTAPSFIFDVSTGGTPATPECGIDEGPLAPFAPCTGPAGFTVGAPLDDGLHVLSVRATDAAGNIGPIAKHFFEVDTIAPIVNLPGAPINPSLTNDRTPSFMFAVSTGGTPTTVECRIIVTPAPLVPPAFGPCTSPFTVGVPLADGGYLLEVRASDEAGHTDSDSHSFAIDTVAPIVTIPGAPINPFATNLSTPTFLFSVDSPSNSLCRITAPGFSTSFASCSAPSFTVGVALADGEYFFEVRATDTANNAGLPETHRFVVDTTAPIVTIPGAPTNPTSTDDTTPTFVFSVSSGGTQTIAECRIDAGPFVSCLFSFTVAVPLAGGPHVLSIRATDEAGNIGPTAGHSFAIATVPPLDPCTTTPLIDNFNRANGALGSNWLDPTKGAFARIKDNRVDVQGGGPVYWDGASFGTNQAAFITLSAVDTHSQSQGLLLKIQPGRVPEAGAISVVYDARARAVDVSTLHPQLKNWRAYTAAPATFVDGDRLGACVTSTGVVSVYKNNALVATLTLNTADQAFFNSKGGKIGLWAVKAAKALFDGFGGGTVVR